MCFRKRHLHISEISLNSESSKCIQESNKVSIEVNLIIATRLASVTPTAKSVNCDVPSRCDWMNRVHILELPRKFEVYIF